MSNEFASKNLTVGQINAIVKKLGGYEAALKFLRGELAVSEPVRAWREHGGIISFSVTSDGTTGEGWITRLEQKGIRVSPCAKSVLRSSEFKPTSGLTTDIVVLKDGLFTDDDWDTTKIREVAASL